MLNIAMPLLRNSGSSMIYIFAYLVLPQKYLCRTDPEGSFESCEADTVICPALAEGSFIEYHVDTSYEYYLNNWQQQMNLMCMPLS